MREHNFSAPVAKEIAQKSMYICANPSTKSLDITVEAVERIMVNPWLPEPLVETVRHVIKSVHGCEKLEVTQSKVTDSPALRKFAATFA